METFKLKVSKTTTEEVEIKLPVFRKGICHSYKVYSSEHCIQVYEGGGIIIAHAELAWTGNDTEDCTEEEFLFAYDEAKNKLEEIALKN